MKKHKTDHRKLFVILIVFFLGAAGLWWGFGREGKTQTPALETTQVIRRDFSATVLATGAVKPQVGAEVRVGARLSGKVDHLYANIGDPVQKGQILAELEKDDLSAEVAQRRAELTLAQAKLSAVDTLGPREIEKAAADLAQYQAALTLAQKDLVRQNELLRQDFTSQQAQDQAQKNLSAAEAQTDAAEKGLDLAQNRYSENLKQARAEISRAEASLDNATVKLSYATITAPISGVIASVSTQEGETVSAGLNAPTFVTIIDLLRLQVDAYVDEVDIGKIQKGQECLFTVDAFSAREFMGRVVAIYPKAVIQENVVNYDVVIKITDPYDGLLRPEMTTNVTISLATRKQVLAVPAQAVSREGGKNIIHIAGATGPEARQVTIGWKDGQWLEIANGLQEGQTIFLGQPKMKNENGTGGNNND
jgi:multidrug resistance efflux pump